jgi:type I restriction enzyme S subunit
MSLPGYERCRNSGVVWLGQVPEHWQVKRLRHLAHVQSGVAKGRDLAGRETIRVPYLRVANVQDGFLDLAEIAMIDIEPHELARYALRPGDVLMNEGGDFDKLGRGHVWRGEIDKCIHQNHVFAVRPNGIEPEWLALVTSANSSRSFFISRSKQSTNLASISQSNLQELPLCVPPSAERRAIIAFLNRETAKIDALVDEQSRLIELLKEKRQAVISHAVTKGLDPNAPMKDSGVEWLGQVPERWEVRKLSTLSTKITNGYVGPTRDLFVDEGVRYLQSLHIKGNRITFDPPYFVRENWSNQHKKSILETGDVLIVQTGGIGQVALVTEEYSGSNCHALIVVSPVRSLVSGDWLSWVLNTDYGFHSLLSFQTGALHPHLNCGNVKDLFLPLPPKEEQQEIVDGLTAQLRGLDDLIAEADRAIALLQERRTALISAAVTGKIDVDGATPAAAEAA